MQIPYKKKELEAKGIYWFAEHVHAESQFLGRTCASLNSLTSVHKRAYTKKLTNKK